jgi:hypothetical protein
MREVTEAEWVSCSDPEPMVRSLPVHRYQRELRLFALAGVRRIYHLLPAASQKLVEVTEQFAEGRASASELNAVGDVAGREAQAHWSGGRSPDARAYAESAALDASSVWPRTAANVLASTSCAASAAACAAADAYDAEYDQVFDAARVAELSAQAELLRGLVTRPPEQWHAQLGAAPGPDPERP